MTLEEIKEIARKDGGKFIIIENDEPLFVIMSFAEYRQKVEEAGVHTEEYQIPKEGGKAEVITEEEAKRAPSDFEIEAPTQKASEGGARGEGELTIEDLPL